MVTVFVFSLAVGVGIYNLLSLCIWPLSTVSQQKVDRLKTLGNYASDWEEASPLVNLALPYLGPLVSQLARRGNKLGLENRLEMSGSQWSITTFYVYKLSLFFLALALGLLTCSQNPSWKNLFAWLFLSFLSYFLPDVRLRAHTLVRREQILREFPDFIDAVRVYLTTGMSIYQAMKYIAEISGQGLKPHLERLSADLELYDQIEALRSFASRINLVEVDNFVGAMEQAIYSGISLKDLFASQSNVLREMRKLAVSKKIKQKPTYLAMVGGLLFLNIFIIVGLPAMVTLLAFRGM